MAAAPTAEPRSQECLPSSKPSSVESGQTRWRSAGSLKNCHPERSEVAASDRSESKDLLSACPGGILTTWTNRRSFDSGAQQQRASDQDDKSKSNEARMMPDDAVAPPTYRSSLPIHFGTGSGANAAIFSSSLTASVSSSTSLRFSSRRNSSPTAWSNSSSSGAK